MPSRGPRRPASRGARSGTESPEAKREARKARRQEDRRAALLEAAREVLTEKGVGGLTMEAVAAAADVSKPAVFYYFRTKEELMGALAAGQLEAEVEVLLRAIAAAPDGVEALVALLRAKVDFYAEDLDAFRVAYLWPQLIGIPPEVLRERVYPASQRVSEALEARLKVDAREGRLAPGFEPRRLANLVWVTAHGLLSLVVGMQQVGGATRHTLTQLRDEACLLLRRARLEG
ncbi:TetR/AcrR family transcriptional regulator [Archangium violaceum]|uniref:TetR family transcriptional regulator n=1 Tax=Archangium violaceum Cb vi76 TaxID=1406225 RepID=A0A084SFM8_9BACT|nr:TetR/AcrR family transcriptional regulator [Archangium violaceum]KFA87263.1 TetR family transcriptional regulator [Archangium violaceum Cb vi76]